MIQFISPVFPFQEIVLYSYEEKEREREKNPSIYLHLVLLRPPFNRIELFIDYPVGLSD